MGFTAVLAAVWKSIYRCSGAPRVEGNRNPPGKLVALYEHYVFTQGAGRDINSFYRMGRRAREGADMRIVPELKSRGQPKLAHDSSTNALDSPHRKRKERVG